jgi:hypothetical protein
LFGMARDIHAAIVRRGMHCAWKPVGSLSPWSLDPPIP